MKHVIVLLLLLAVIVSLPAPAAAGGCEFPSAQVIVISDDNGLSSQVKDAIALWNNKEHEGLEFAPAGEIKPAHKRQLVFKISNSR